MSKPSCAVSALPGERIRRLRETLDKILRMFIKPGVIEAEVVRNKIEDELEAVTMKFVPELLQSRLAAKDIRNTVGGDGISRGVNSGMRPAREDFVVQAALIRMTDGGGARPRTAGPNAHGSNVR